MTYSKVAGLAAGVLMGIMAHGTTPAAELAESYPSKPVRFVVQGAPGSAPDSVARTLARPLSASLGRPFVIDTRAGAAGMVAAQIAIAAPPDGYTVLLGASGALTIVPFLGTNRPYDPQRDLAPLTLAASQPLFIAAHSSLAIGSIKELIARAKSAPNEIRFGSHGTGSVQHLTMELFTRDAGVTVAHIPYKGGAFAVTAAASGETQIVVSGLASLRPHVRSARLRILAVTSAQRAGAEPDVPTVHESGLRGFDVVTWYGIFAPAKTPAELVQKLYIAVRRAAGMPEVQGPLAQNGLKLTVTGPAALAATVRADASKWQRLIRERGIAID